MDSLSHQNLDREDSFHIRHFVSLEEIPRVLRKKSARGLVLRRGLFLLLILRLSATIT